MQHEKVFSTYITVHTGLSLLSAEDNIHNYYLTSKSIVYLLALKYIKTFKYFLFQIQLRLGLSTFFRAKIVFKKMQKRN